MRYFSTLSPARKAALFHRVPGEFFRDSSAQRLAMALGATLYAPAVRPDLAADIARCHRAGVMSMVCCLEDAVRDDEVADAESNLVRQLRRYAADGGEGPLLFVRVRAVEQISRLADRLGDALRMLSGFVLPKFRSDAIGHSGVETVRKLGADAGLPMYVMPVLETPEVAWAESRLAALRDLHGFLDSYRESVLAVRVGGTDLCGLYGLRRPVELTAWEIGLVAGVLTDIVNVFGRRDGSGFPVTGPVWEYFAGGDRILRPQLRASPFAQHEPDGDDLRRRLLQRSLDGLIRETMLDRANGLMGKTVIHPTHASTVHALSVVSHEEYSDSTAILGDGASVHGGVLRSAYDNKMNEVGPHRHWAELTLQRAEIFGVAREGVTFVDFLDAHDRVGSTA
ncbi:HpcH/HpaI aldolase/citrate lyase family protein [Spirilliplanes yamanashiensis]|uniref:ATP/GTP-binding protein n=1 Tax=Spirilliplanes yamanashiensis TaxID=42233 RepID=A0A8J3Y7X2_9ACTN|nr:HpcH/HpaI aldolase/citrate lyase family protein [Spirilliplanes yamanashiensis]MDP9817207.1 citrate lyase beta subunit [Spirilliplanes yamanashiensis]GIJ03139.1 ATP/GTP-binding protein [Spirilliplanes yamanashiensis]